MVQIVLKLIVIDGTISKNNYFGYLGCFGLIRGRNSTIYKIDKKPLNKMEATKNFILTPESETSEFHFTIFFRFSSC